MRFLLLVFVLLLAGMTYVRLAPTDPARWHQWPDVAEPLDRQTAGGFTAARKITAPARDVLAAVVAVAGTTPRTKVLAGSVDAGMITFETRSRIFGFPDYTTVAVQDGLLVMQGRLRFGSSDLGVNKARILGWVSAVAPLTEPL